MVTRGEGTHQVLLPSMARAVSREGCARPQAVQPQRHKPTSRCTLENHHQHGKGEHQVLSECGREHFYLSLFLT